MKIIYSVNIGGYDNFNTPRLVDSNVRYILFTDNKIIKSKVWEIQHVDFLSNLDNRKKARYIKLNPHKILPNHEVSLWVDHNLIPKIGNFKIFLKNIGWDSNKNIMAYKHRIRNCIYDECQKVIEIKKESETIAKKQIEKYKTEGFPKNYGLFETGFLLRRNNEENSKFNDLWWNEVNLGSGRDQLSQMYVSWKLNLKINEIGLGESAYKNQFSESVGHIKNFKI